ncbi:MAG: flavodoxin family protein [Planctomycetota bacterium]|jgi:NAD(P)H dehydrogenase (quinone)
MASILVLYHSQEKGHTAQMAEAVADGARAAGAEVKLFNTNDGRFDVEQFRAADAAAFGSPDYFSYIAGGLKVFLDDWCIARWADRKGLEDKPYALFFSHGGGGKVREPMEKLFEAFGKKVGKTVGSQGAPSDEVLASCRELGGQLAEAAGK